MKSKTIITYATAIALILSGLTSWYRYQALRYLNVEFEIQVETTTEKPILQLFYDIGEGYREKDSQSFWLTTENKFQLIFCRIPASELHGLRIDFLNGSGKATFHKINIFSNSRESVFTLSKHTKIEQNQIELLNITSDQIQTKTINSANDPYLIFPFPTSLRPSLKKHLTEQLLFTTKIFFIIFITLTTVLLLTRQRD